MTLKKTQLKWLAWGILGLCGLRSVAWAAAESLGEVDTKIKLESQVADQIRSDLKSLLGEGNFFVTVDADIVREEAKEVVQEESASVTPSKGEVAADLPGFSQFSASSAGNGQSAQKKIFKVSQADKLNKLVIRLFVAQTLSAETEALLKNYLHDKWVTAVPDITDVQITRVAASVLKAPSPELHIEELLSRARDLARNPWAGFAGVGLLAGLIFLLARPTAKEGGGKGTQVTVTGNGNGDKEEAAELAAERLATLKKGFIDEVVEEPIYARGFLSALDDERKEHLMISFKDPLVHDLMQHLMGGNVVQGAHFKGAIDPTQNGNVFFPELLNEIRGYKKIRQQQKDTPLAFLRDLRPHEIISLLGAQPLGVWASALSILSNDTIEGILYLIPSEQRMELASRLAKESTTATPSTEEVDVLLRPSYDRMAKNLLIPTHSSSELLNVMLESADDSSLIAEKILSERQDLQPLVGKYLFSFDRLLNLEAAILAKILGDLDNETIIAALQGLDKKGEEQFLKVLSSERRLVIKHMKPTILSQVTEAQVKKARGQMIRKARATTQI